MPPDLRHPTKLLPSHINTSFLSHALYVFAVLSLYSVLHFLPVLYQLWLLWPFTGYRKKNIIDTRRDVRELSHIHSQSPFEQKWGKGHDLYRKCIWCRSIAVAARFNSIYSESTYESGGSLHAVSKDTHLRGERKAAVGVIVLVSSSRKEIAGVQCWRGQRKSSKCGIMGVLEYQIKSTHWTSFIDVISYSLSLLLLKRVQVLYHTRQEFAVILNIPRKWENLKKKNRKKKTK